MIFRRKPQPDALSAQSVPTDFDDDVAVTEAGVSAVPEPIETLQEMGVELPQARVEGAACGPVWALSILDDDPYAAADLWSSIRDRHPRTGWWPVLAGPDTLQDVVTARHTEPVTPTAGDGAAWLRARAEETLEELPVGAVQPVDDPDFDAFDWSDALNASTRVFDRLLLVPARAGWSVPGLIGWDGALNADVLGDDHATILRRWAGRWAVELVGLERDVLTVRVQRPPAGAGEALIAATEAALYCSDLLSRSSRTLWTLAPAMTQPLWSFWWD